MENYIRDMLANLTEAQDELKPRVVDGEDGAIENCAEKIGEVLQAVNYWSRTIENGGAVQPADIEETLDTLHCAQDSVKEYLDNTGWKDNRACNAFASLDQAINSTGDFLENSEA